MGYTRSEQKVLSPPVDKAWWVMPTPNSRLHERRLFPFAQASPYARLSRAASHRPTESALQVWPSMPWKVLSLCSYADGSLRYSWVQACVKPLPLPFVRLRLGSDAVSVKSLRCHICSVWPRCSPIFYCHEREVTRVFEIFENSLSQKLKLCIWAGSKSRVQSFWRSTKSVLWRTGSVFVVRGVPFGCARRRRALPAEE